MGKDRAGGGDGRGKTRTGGGGPAPGGASTGEGGTSEEGPTGALCTEFTLVFLIAIGGYSISEYWWLFYYWLFY